MTTDSGDLKPGNSIIDVEQLAALESQSPGSAKIVLDLLKMDMKWNAKRIDRQDRRDHVARMWTIFLTVSTILSIAGLSSWIILAGAEVAGSILAAVDLVALASVLINSWRRVDPAASNASPGA